MPSRRINVFAGQPEMPVTRGLVAVYDPTDRASMTIVGGSITGIRNKVSGVVLPYDTNGPTLGDIAGSDAMAFNGTNQQLIGTEAAVVAALQVGTPYWIVAVVQLNAVGSNQTIVGAGTPSGSPHDARRSWGQNTASKWQQVTLSDAGVAVGHLSESLTDTSPHVFMWFGGGADATGAVDAIAPDPNAAADAPGTTTLTRFALGVIPAHTLSQRLNGKLGFVAIYNIEPTQAEIEAMYEWVTTTRALVALPLPRPTVDPSIIDILAIVGQSNATGRATKPPYVPTPRWYWPHCVPMNNPTQLVQLGPYDGLNHGVEMRLVQLFASVGLDLAIFKSAEGATGLHTHWQPGQAGWTQVVNDWATVLPLLRAKYPGKTFRYHFLYDQGEYEQELPDNDPDAVNYQAYLEDLIDHSRTDLPGFESADFHVIRKHSFPSASAINTALVQAAEDAVALSRPNVHVHNSDNYICFSGDIHVNAQGFDGPPHTAAEAYDLAVSLLSLLP